jgi:ABC-type Fe3+ transport system permease subunit
MNMVIRPPFMIDRRSTARRRVARRCCCCCCCLVVVVVVVVVSFVVMSDVAKRPHVCVLVRVEWLRLDLMMMCANTYLYAGAPAHIIVYVPCAVPVRADGVATRRGRGRCTYLPLPHVALHLHVLRCAV